MDANVSTPRRLPAAALTLALATLAGCASSNPLAERRTMLGTLRSNVAQLESEKYQLQKDLARARADNRDLEDRLVQEQAENQALARRLDDSGRLSRGDAFESGAEPLDLSRGSAEDPFAPGSDPSRRAAPVSQPKGRKVPFAQIPGQIRPLPDERGGFAPPPDDEDAFQGSDLFPSANDLGSRDDGFGVARARWLPVARGLGGSNTRVR
jgi:outer membrane murein-binding lipoprotein Lpp